MAVVYRAWDRLLEREVAVKVLHPHLASHPESRARLEREAQAVAKLRHPNILEIYDYSGPASTQSFLVTELIRGTTLKGLLAERPLPYVELGVLVLAEVAAALEHAHAHGVLHRDVKPENVMIRSDGVVKLTDFGIAQLADKESMTVTGQLLGSPAYMSPEHVEGQPLDARTDVFAVGVLAYQLATGELPFRGRNPHEVLKRIAECRFTPPERLNPRIGRRHARLITRALSRAPSDRFATMAALRTELLSDLEETGLDAPSEELRLYWADRERYEGALGPRLVEGLTQRGKELRRKGQSARALELWGRALAMAPRSAELQALLDGMALRRRLLRASVAVGALGAIGATTLFAYQGLSRLRSHREELVQAPSPTPAPPRQEAPAPAPRLVTPLASRRLSSSSAPSSLRTVERPVLPRSPALAEPARPTPAPATRRLELRPSPQAVRISLDGAPAVDYDPTHAWELAPGAHSFRIESDCCFTRQLEVGANEQGELPIRLDWRPATLTIRTTPPTADIVIEGLSTVFSPGQPIQVPIGTDATSSRRRIVVRVSAPQHRTSTRAVTVRAAEIQTLDFALEPLTGAP
jgi:serine/threonine-protein kinase